MKAAFYGGGGHDVLIGGPDADAIYGDEGNDQLRAGGSRRPENTRDLLRDNGGKNRLIGSADGDLIIMFGGTNVARGGGGNDDLVGLKGSKNRYYAGSGDDYVNSRNRARERVDCGRGRDKVRADRHDRLVRCERHVGPSVILHGERPDFRRSPNGDEDPGGGGRGR